MPRWHHYNTVTNLTSYQITQPLCIIVTQVLGCPVQRSLSCHDPNLVDLSASIVQLIKQHQLDSLLQEVCIYDLAHSELKLLGLSVEIDTMPSSLISLSRSRSWCWPILQYVKSYNLSVLPWCRY